MKFVLKDGLIHIVDNHGLPNNSIEGSVLAPGLSGYTLQYSINKGKYKALAGKIVIPKEALSKTSLELVVRASKGSEVLYFKSDVIPLTHAVVLGKSLEDSYPEALKYLLKEIKRLKLLMGEVVDTFEDITKKGSLF